MSYAQIVAFDTIRKSLASGITTTYSKLGGITTHPMRLSCLSNNSTTDVFIAVTNGSTPLSDGTQDQIYVPMKGFKLYDLTSNKVDQIPSVFCIAEGQQLWVRNSAEAASVYLEFIYGNGET